MRIEKDEWLSDVLALPSYKVLGIEASDPLTQIQKSMLDLGHDSAFCSAKVSTRDVAALANATRSGFSVVDVNVTFEWNRLAAGVSGATDGNDNGITIELARSDDVAGIEAVAEHAFVFSRFHLDAAIGLGRANEVKRLWARNACHGRASSVYVARKAEAVIGFLAVIESSSSNGTSAVIDLVGVGSGYRGQGAGRKLSRMFVDSWRDRADRLRVGTQISNIPALRLYESMGFRVAETAYVLHAHVRNGAIAT